MKKKLFLVIASVLMVMALLATPVLAAIPSVFLLESFWMTDPLFEGKPNPNIYKNANPGDKVPGYWWRDATNQNAIAEYYWNDNYPPRVLNPAPGVFVMRGFGNTQVVGLVGPTGWVLIDTMESPTKMEPVLSILNRIAGGKPLEALIYTSERLDHISGSAAIPTNVPVYASSGLVDLFVKQLQGGVLLPRTIMTSGQELPGVPDELDGRIGPPTDFALRAFKLPNKHISEPTIVTLAGNMVTLFPSQSASDARLSVYLHELKVLIDGDTVTSAFPDIGPLTRPTRSVDEWIYDIGSLRGFQAEHLVSTHGNGMVISGQDSVFEYLTNYLDAVTYIRDRTLQLMETDSGLTAEDIAAQVNLPEYLASEPYLQEFENSIPSAVKAIYHGYAGWFNGAPPELASTLTTTRHAEIMTDLAGGMNKLIDKAKKAELEAQDLLSAEKAMLLAYSAYNAALTDSEHLAEAKDIYIQTLRKNAYMQKSDQIRNYYLSVAMELELQ